MKVTVCGAGPAGLGMAASLSSSGHAVKLYEFPEYEAKIAPFRAVPVLRSVGRVPGDWPLTGVTADPAEALRDAEVVFVVMHAAAHKRLGALFAPYVRATQLFVLCPGYVGGGVELTAALTQNGAPCLPPYAEVSSLPITANMSGSAVEIKAWKHGFSVFCPQNLRTHPAVAWLEEQHGPLSYTESPIEPGLNEINIVVHCVTTLLNPSRVDGGAPWTFYREGLSPSVVRVIEAVDAERVALERALGLTPRRLTDMLWQFYGDQGMARPEDGLYKQLSTFESFATVPGPLSWEHRFISEDLRCGIVPMYHLGRQKGLDMPATRAVIALASAYTGRDEMSEGRRVKL